METAPCFPQVGKPLSPKGGEVMNKYETTFVLDAGVDQAVIDNEIGNIERIITAEGGKVLDVEKWGFRRFAYVLKKRHHGNYIHIKFEGSGTVPDQLARQFRINENILRFLTVVSREVGESAGAIQRQKANETEAEKGIDDNKLGTPQNIDNKVTDGSDTGAEKDNL